MPAIAQALALNSPWPSLSADSLEHWQQARQALSEAAGSSAFLQAADMRGSSMHAHFPLQRDHTFTAGGILLPIEIYRHRPRQSWPDTIKLMGGIHSLEQNFGD